MQAAASRSWLSCVLPCLAGCGGDLLPDEAVLGHDVPAVVIEGTTGSRLGAALATGELDDGRPAVAIAAPDDGRVEVRDRDGALLWEVAGEWGLGVGMAWRDGLPVGLQPGQGVVELGPDGPVLLREQPSARDLAVCPDGALVTVQRSDEAVACGPDGRLIELRCEGSGDCEVHLDGAVVDQALPGGDVGFYGGLACWGWLDLDDEQGAGVVRCEDGSELPGITGEHLGVGLASGWATGTFTKWEVPARGRALPLSGRTPDGQRAWVVERAAEATALSVAASGQLVAVGVPGYLDRSASTGRVYLVDLDNLGEALP